MEFMAATSSRTLRLLSLLQSHRFWPGDELAGRMGVSIRTLRRDVDRLRELGYPVQARRGVDGGYQLAAGAVLPPLVMDEDEAVALVTGLLQSARDPADESAQAAVRALAKIIQVMPGALRRKVDALQRATQAGALAGAAPPLDPGILTTLAQACRDGERVAFGYTAAGGAVSERLVEPLRLVPVGRRWYLVAYDTDRLDWRSFRLDRIDTARTTGRRFAPHTLPAEDAAAFVRAGLQRHGQRHQVLATVRASADTVRAAIGRWATVEADGPERCRVTIHADSLDWAAMALGVTGCEFTVLDPPDAVTHIRDWAARFARAAAS
jgi:predicted DNA-binding transcriptional regulator YafY